VTAVPLADLVCGVGYCDRPAAVYVSRAGPGLSGGRLLAIAGPRAAHLATTGPSDGGAVLSLRCAECAHHELDDLINAVPVTGHRLGGAQA
jgi:hypothetical protein